MFPETLPLTGATLPLSQETIRRVRAYFDAETQHRPSAQQWAALEDLATTLESLASGSAERRFYLSSCDPGVGKTTVLASFVDTLLDDRARYDVGVLVCLSRLVEIRTLVARMNLPREWVGVLTRDKETNDLGCPEADHGSARALFTTQQLIESRCSGRRFQRAGEFFYQDRPRAVRVWDESMIPGAPVTLSRYDMGFLPRLFGERHPKLARALDDLSYALREAPDGSPFTVPDFPSLFDVDTNAVMGAAAGRAEDQQAVVAVLWYLAGRTGRVRQDDRHGNTLLTYRETLPLDLAPVVVLDASGRVRETYTEWEEQRGTLKRLKSAPKRYDNLSIHVWNRGGGKASYRESGEEIAEGCARTILTKPTEDWLVVVHRPDGKHDMASSILERLPQATHARVKFLTWGQHQATNDHKDTPNVILAGTLWYRPSYYEALGRASAGTADTEAYPTVNYDRIVAGEHRSLVLQAICRAAVRKSLGDGCYPCDAYVIATVRSGIPGSLKDVFPGCRVLRWQPIPRVIGGKVKAALDVIRRWLETTPDPDAVLPFKVVQRAVGIRDAATFRKDVREHRDFREELEALGLREAGRRYMTGWARFDARAIFDTAPGNCGGIT